MKIVLAPDKFKNSLTGLEFCDAVEKGIRAVTPNCDIIKLPLADGGDGTIEVVNYYLKGKTITTTVNNPFFEPIEASYLYAEVSKTAFIEMAEASGVKLLQPEQFDCKNATTLGTGELIIDAIEHGAKHIILGIGGSATNDCGIGMASALGYHFLDEDDAEVKPIGANLSHIKTIDTTKIQPKLGAVNFRIACDVSNPLYGKNGAAYVYAKQKGATDLDIEMLDKGLSDFAKVLESTFGVNPQSVKGAGAAGGMGIASKVFLNGVLMPGITLIKDLAKFDQNIANADWIITGEGKLDTQTFSGKTIKGVLDSAKAQKVKVAAFCGAVDLDEIGIKRLGLEYTNAVMHYAKNLEDAIENDFNYVTKIAENFAKKHLI
ncbi:glycerate kinase [Hyunsoonleella pacifica]|uniref:Glycerate kinase n=1 Tax=Hyunsoonleella pacifica TaxID=1080224 RepID=A0A4Q9FMT3_9FLAO|nr:glycerate kinase [Hyunsoonleella pacifica]TBN15742.1 glycerate kinase [Hyunsoonleella pacifica]GGD22212.1 glycerate kinase [Hyunsoonleella pacifica]